MPQKHKDDFYGWTQEQVEVLRSGNLKQLDIENIMEEIEGMGSSQRSELESRLEVLLVHLLKWKLQPSHQGQSWKMTIAEQRRKIARRLLKNPSLKHELDELIDDAYGDAILSAVRETGLGEKVFPESCPWTFAQFMDAEFYPES